MLLSMIQNIKHISWNFLFGNWCSVGIYAIGISHKRDEIWNRFSNDEIDASLDLYHIWIVRIDEQISFTFQEYVCKKYKKVTSDFQCS